MTRHIPEMLQKYLTSSITAVVLMGLPEYLRINEFPVPPFVWALSLLITFGFIALRGRDRVEFTHATQTLIKEPLFWWWIGFVISGLIAILVHGAHSFALEDLMRRVSAAGGFLLMLLFMLISTNVRKWVQTGILWGGILLSASILLGYLRIGFIDAIDCRPGGFLVNPNTAAYALCFCLIGSCSACKSRTLQTVSQTFFLFAIFITASRSGLLAAAITIAALAFTQRVDVVRTLGLTVVLLASLATISLLGVTHNRTTSCLQEVVSDRFNFGVFQVQGPENTGTAVPAKPLKPDGPDERSLIDHLYTNPSTQERIEYGSEAYERFIESPLTGDGIDPELGNQTHNEFLSLTSQHGLIGLILFISFWFVLYKSGVTILVLLPFFFVAMFSHTFYYERFTLIVLAFLTATAITERRKRNGPDTTLQSTRNSSLNS